MVRTYLPSRGDIIWLDMNPSKGHEQSGRRPVLVLSSRVYNNKTGLSVVVPITSKVKGYLFEVPIKIGGTNNAVLVDHVRSVSWKNRRSQYIKRADNRVVVAVIGKLISLLTSKE